MAGIITISPGHDASYPWRQIGASVDTDHSGRAGTDYYLSPAEKGGEPPGRWRGAGLVDLGFRDGQVIDREVFERLYGKFADPRDPSGETRLGRSPQRFRPAEEVYSELLALEPEATAERRAELLIEAKSQVRTPVQYFDATFSVSKSITLLHASAMANAARAAADGNMDAVRYWERTASEVWACIEAGNQAALEYLQREAGYTRSGYHGRNAAGVEAGRWEDAHGFIVGSFAQHTSRDGDPQLHIHNLILNRVMRERDGAYRTLDSRALHEHRGAAGAVATLVMESALSRAFGVGWVGRGDGHGREVRGVSAALMEEFSSRRESISTLTARLAGEFEAQHGYAPDAQALGKLRRWANHASRRAKGAEPLDLAALARRWAAQARASEAGALELVLPAVSSRRGRGSADRSEPMPIWELSPEQEREVMALALARVHEAQPTWRKADLISHLGELLPDDVACRDDTAAAAILPTLAERVLAGGAGETVVALEAPEWPRVPNMLRRSDGRSIYRPHDGIRYATLGQLTVEERLVATAQQPGAPRLEPALAARLLGADLARLQAQLAEAAQHVGADSAQERTGSGLRLDQAAATFAVLTSDRLAEILVGPAGSGKTTVAAQVARMWRDAGLGEVYGLTTSQAARNVLREAGVDLADNTAEFLGHLAGQREARGPRTIRPGTLLLLDEASMMSIADMAAILRTAAAGGCRVLIMGDHEQLAAVEGGGGLVLLTRRIGFVQLAEPVRFACGWERDATLRLRCGDVSVLAMYQEQGRLRGGDPEEAMELACRAFIADHLAGKDSLLLARTGEQARELGRRVRDDLVRYGLVHVGTEVRLRHGAVAGIGDLIVARRNQRAVRAGERGRWLTNRDVLRVEAVAGRTVSVRRQLRRDGSGARADWSVPFELPRTYLFSFCDLAYSATAHAAQGRTVDTAHVLVDGLGSRQSLYSAMSRGREANYAYCLTGLPRAADVRRGSRPAPELDRVRRTARERAGLGPPPGNDRREEQAPRRDEQAPHRDEQAPHRDEISVLAEVLQRDGAVLPATETLRAALSDADHLGVLGSIWYDQVRRIQAINFERNLRQCLSAADADAALSDPASVWLWRTLREAEATGADSADVLQVATAVRSLAGSRHIARVLDSRIRRTLRDTAPTPRGTWAEHVPVTGDPDLDRFLTELAAAMDDRTRRIGEHAAQARPQWVTQALGPVPDDLAARVRWEGRAARLGAYRELYGHDAQDSAIGPEPGKTSPEARADWHTAFIAVGRIDGIDLRGCTDNQLRLRRALYQREASWAPPFVGEELRLARLQARTGWENAIRAEHEARDATDPQIAERHEGLARMWHAMETKATAIADTLAAAQETRRQWESLTEPTRQVAIAADHELRCRHPRVKVEPLAAAEPAGDWNLSDESALGLTPMTVHDHVPGQVERIRENARKAQEEIDRLRGTPRFAEDDDTLYIGPAWGSLAGRDRDAILQRPKPDLVPADAIVERMRQRLPDREPELS